MRKIGKSRLSTRHNRLKDDENKMSITSKDDITSKTSIITKDPTV